MNDMGIKSLISSRITQLETLTGYGVESIGNPFFFESLFIRDMALLGYYYEWLDFVNDL